MKIALYIFWVLNIAVFGRSVYLAMGKSKAKIWSKESFLFWQKIVLCILAAAIIIAVASAEFTYLYLFMVNLLILFLFYLQPTPRISRYLLYAFIIANFTFFLILFL